MAKDSPAAGKEQQTEKDEIALIGRNSPGVRRIEAIAKHITTVDRVFLFFSIFLLSYVYGLDSSLRFVYQPYATASYANHSLLATMNVLRAVIAAAAQPTAAKIADVFGRVELVLVAIAFYVVGTIVEATSEGVKSFAGGAILYQIGFTCTVFLVEVIIADITSLRSRLFFSYIPGMPFIINTWVAPYITAAVLAATSWNWAIGMWSIIYPVCTIPLLLSLYLAHRRAKKHADLENYSTPYRMLGAKKLTLSLFWQLDVIGIILIIAVFALILVPFTIAGGESTNWHRAYIIAPLVVGLCCIPAFVIYEKKAPHPMVPFHLLKDRAVWGALMIACFLNFAWYMQGDYLYTVLVVSFDFSTEAATRITLFYGFFSVVTGIIVGIIVFFVRRLKPFIVTGTLLFLVAFGLLIQYRGGASSAAGVIAAQVFLGIAGGFFPYPAQASIQAATRHEHVAVITGLYLASYNVGSALGNTVSGAIWTQVLPSQLNTRLAPVTNNATMAAAVYGDPFTFATEYAMDTPERMAVVDAYRYAQRLLCIAGICLCVPIIIGGAVLRNPRLPNTQSMPNAEGTDSDSEMSQHEDIGVFKK